MVSREVWWERLYTGLIKFNSTTKKLVFLCGTRTDQLSNIWQWHDTGAFMFCYRIFPCVLLVILHTAGLREEV